MKKIIAWVLRICCFVVIGAASLTLIRCLIHVNDDHSKAALLEDDPVQTFESGSLTASDSELPLLSVGETEENPTVILSADGGATANHPTVTTTASFSNIVNSVVADLAWYVDGVLVKEESDCLLVDGSTRSFNVTVDVTEESPETTDVSLTVAFQEKTVDAETSFPVERLGAENSVVIQTAEITVTARRGSDIYEDGSLDEETGETMEKSEEALLLGYETDNSGLSALKLKFEDGSEGWVKADDMKITNENCTTDEDYTDQQKMDFVNSMNYDSRTSYLVWVSLYTQKVNVFRGYKCHWELEESFDCASGVNETPTTTGIFALELQKDRWDLGKTYVEPVLVFNGGEAFTSQPYDAETDEIADDTIGEPASGGGVWLQEDDIQWMVDNLPLDTMVVVY